VTNESSPVNQAQTDFPVANDIRLNWSKFRAATVLVVVTLVCLLPFVNKAFHIDDPLFVWTAQHIAEHPLDPYGFRVVWYATESPVSDVTKNPPLASYYAALAGTLAGWSERTLHLAFFIPALIAVLGTYRLASRYTKLPVLAAAITLFSPGFLVSSTSVMCDTTMLAFWILAVVFWFEGLDAENHFFLAVSALLIAAAALSKYFGISLIPLLLLYTLQRQRRLTAQLAYLSVPVLALIFYQQWTHALYGRGLLSDAVQYASLHDRGHGPSLAAKTLVGLAFAGGCTIPAFFFAPLLWTRKGLFFGAVGCAMAGAAISSGWIHVEAPLAAPHWTLVSSELAIYLAGGISIFGLVVAGASYWKHPETVLLLLWITGTLIFAAFVNWTINARSVLPMIPAVAILVARGLELQGTSLKHSKTKIGVALLASAIVSIWVAQGDANLANAGRTAAYTIYSELQTSNVPLYFEGHWGFHYYMQNLGARPADLRHSLFHAGDVLAIPENTTNSFGPPPGFQLEGKVKQIDLSGRVTTMSQPLGAGFYAAVWGPLPFAIGPVPPERYLLARLVRLENRNDPFASLPKP
jgi:hypothetical protein